jgi:hypothetical protein
MGPPERAGDVESIAGTGSRAAKRAPSRGGADENDIRQDEIGRGFRGIASSERGAMLLGERAKSGEEAVDPASSFSSVEQIGWKSQGEEGGQRLSPHGGKVAETTGEAAIPD